MEKQILEAIDLLRGKGYIVTKETTMMKLLKFEYLMKKWGLEELTFLELNDWHNRMVWHVERCGEFARIK